MHPVLFTIPIVNLPVHAYGVFIVMGFLAALYLAARETKRVGRFHDDVLDFAFWALLGGMIGARVVFIIVNWQQYFVDSPFDSLGPVSVRVLLLGGGGVLALIGLMGIGDAKPLGRIFVAVGFALGIIGALVSPDVVLGPVSVPAVLVVWKGGLVFYGAALGGFLAFLLFARRRNIRGPDMLQMADIVVVGLPLAAAFGRLGCVSAGCCWGDGAFTLDAAGHFHATIPFSLQFPPGALAYQSLLTSEPAEVVAAMKAAGSTAPLIPIQLIDAIGELGLFSALLVVRSRKWFHGQVLLSYGLLYPVWRTILEMFRGDGERGYLIPGLLSTSQFISLCVAGLSLTAMLVIRRRSLQRAQAALHPTTAAHPTSSLPPEA